LDIKNFDIKNFDLKKNYKALIGFAVGGLACLVALFFMFSTPTTPKEQFRKVLTEFATNDNFLSKITSTFKLTKEKDLIVRDHYKAFFSQEYIDYFIDVLDEKGVFNQKKLDQKKALGMFLTVANDISLKGIKHISDDYKYYLFLYNVKMHTFLDDVRCKSYFVGDPRLFYKVNMDKVLSKVFN